MPLPDHLIQFLASVHPYDRLPEPAFTALAELCEAETFATQDTVFQIGDDIASLYIVAEGEVEITDEAGIQLSILGPRNSFGERALLRGQSAQRVATATRDSTLIVLPTATFFDLIDKHTPVARFFDRRRPARAGTPDIGTMRVETLMTRDPISCPPSAPIRQVAQHMADRNISSVCIGDTGDFRGIVTLRDMNAKVILGGVDPNAPVSTIMTADPLTLGADALVTDVLHMMVERSIRQVPILDNGTLTGIVTQTDLTRAQAISSADIVGRAAKAADAAELSRATAEIPKLLVQLVESGIRHEAVTRLITDIADTVTRRLLTLAEAQLGPAPVPYLWLACGSQGRQEQTGVSDQDNCMILSDDVTDAQMPYFAKLAKFVSDGLDQCGYFYCPGDMMATNPRWCQPLREWRAYFEAWIAKPNPEAQMLASVMFDLRPIGGDTRLFDTLHTDTLKAAAENSIFAAHMISNSLKHHPPLGLLRGLATIRSGTHRNHLDLKHNGVVPVVDLGRIYALQGQIRPVNTHARLEAAVAEGVLSSSGGADLIDAYDLIATTRLEHQAAQIKAGDTPGNYLNPSELSDFERSHLRDAFLVVKTMQSAVGSGKSALG
ncbi:histidine kinase [Actibacterium mucosum KCTC 23349]|uniref:Histidine kinase n=1 Tax=Actibacterium mucosum KCTC 23349 TaxID=1454373 RepID=A0A037ZNE5_9RHOB|nr:DUF294 nucleotidyltransferase-like domain-containing protein [Actibacterium mucosum]KAJ56356.1 histidine kinase [Actibacterium mucosum KCTC 23349]